MPPLNNAELSQLGLAGPSRMNFDARDNANVVGAGRSMYDCRSNNDRPNEDRDYQPEPSVH